MGWAPAAGLQRRETDPELLENTVQTFLRAWDMLPSSRVTDFNEKEKKGKKMPPAKMVMGR